MYSAEHSISISVIQFSQFHSLHRMSMLLRTRSLLLSIPTKPSPPSPFFFTCSSRFFPFSTSSIPPPSTPSAILQFLEKECDFSPPQISKIMKAKKSLMRVRSTQTAREAVEFLREQGFTHSQLHNTIIGYPSLLCLRVDRNIKPIFDFLTLLGITNQDLRILISRYPRLVGSSLDKNIKPRMLYLEKLFGSNASVVKAFKRAPQLLSISFEKQLKPKVDCFKRWGIQGELLSLLFSISPNSFSRISMELFQIRLEYVKNTIGVVEGSKTFVYTVSIILSIGPENLEKKVKHLESLGLLKEEVQQLLRKYPLLFALSTDKMQRNMDFLTHTAGFQPNVVLTNVRLLHFSVENWLKPRLAVFQALCAMQQVQPTPNLFRILSLSQKNFLQNVVECSPQAEILKEVYKRKVTSTDVEIT